MYYSHSYQDETFEFFVAFLQNALKGIPMYKELVQPVIQDAHLLATGEKNYFTVNRDNYSIIAYLVEADQAYFKTIDPARLTDSDYNHILDIAKSQREAFLA